MQSDPSYTYLGGSLYSDVPCLGEEGGGSCTVRSKLNTFEHAGEGGGRRPGQGPCTGRGQDFLIVIKKRVENKFHPASSRVH